MAMQPLSLKRGTSSSLSVTIPNAIDPVGATVFFTVKPAQVIYSLQDSDEYAIIKKAITTHSGRIFTTDIDPEDTQDATPGNYSYGFTVVDAAGQVVGTKANGQFTLEPRDTADVEV